MTTSRKKVMVLFGTRPELIKLAPVIKALKGRSEVESLVCSTGQHREMLRQVMDIFDIHLDADLDLMRPNQDLFDLSSNVMLSLREVFGRLKPDVVIVQGDTTTAFIAALSAFYLNIKVAHVEAGLRSYSKKSPFPEEANRRWISVVADYHFAPTLQAEQVLLREGFKPETIWVTGNTVVDALEWVKNKVLDPKQAQKSRDDLAAFLPSSVFEKPFVLVTLHRREKFGDAMMEVLDTLKKRAEAHPELNFIYPLHLNPNVMNPAHKILDGVKNMFLIPPQDYLCFNYLMSKCKFIVTDSGGIQEEAFTYAKPLLVLRDVTERMEVVEAGYAFLVGHDAAKITTAFEKLNTSIDDGHAYFTMQNPYGDGKAAERIAKVLAQTP